MQYVLLAAVVLCCRTHGLSQWGHRKLTEYQPGSEDTRLLIVAGHGGTEAPEDIPDRERGCLNKETGECVWTHDCPVGTERVDKKCGVTTVLDFQSDLLATKLRDSVANLTGGVRPHIVLCHLRRTKVDVNRPRDQAALGHPEAEQVYDDFHGFIRDALSRIGIKQPGLVLDLHGQSHSERWVEIGFLIHSSVLDEGGYMPNDTSIYSIVHRTGADIEELVYGETSLGALLEGAGYKSVPSPSHPGPGGGRYYRGGFITQTYGSRGNALAGSDAIQLENPKYVRVEPEMTRFAGSLAEAVISFMDNYYGSASQNANMEVIDVHQKVVREDQHNANMAGVTAGRQTFFSLCITLVWSSIVMSLLYQFE